MPKLMATTTKIIAVVRSAAKAVSLGGACLHAQQIDGSRYG